jgi:hypothetical protein
VGTVHNPEAKGERSGIQGLTVTLIAEPARSHALLPAGALASVSTGFGLLRAEATRKEANHVKQELS